MLTGGSAKKGSNHEYLIQLQEKNRLLKKLQYKNSEQRMLEQREQGFSLYLNGANAGLQLPLKRHSRKLTATKQTRDTKTAGSGRLISDHGNQHVLQCSENIRAMTAPLKERLKWGHHSCNVTAVDGEMVHISAPDSKFTGNYDDDFEFAVETSGNGGDMGNIQLDLSSDNTKVLREALQEVIGDDDDMKGDCSDDSIGCSSDEEDTDDKPIMMQSASVTKATRSLSAVQRKQPSADNTVSDDVLLALQQENVTISHSSAAVVQQPHPPATPSTTKTIEIVTAQVKLMNYRQQKSLLHFLEQLEKLPSPPSSNPTCSMPHPTYSMPHPTCSMPHSNCDKLSTGRGDVALPVAKKQLPSSAGSQRRPNFDWLKNDKMIQRSLSVGKLSDVIGLEEGAITSSRIPSGRTSGLRGLLSRGGHQLEQSDDTLQAKSGSHLPTFLDDAHPAPVTTQPSRLATAVVSRQHDFCLPRAEETDVTELYRDHLIASHDPDMPHGPVMSHDPNDSSASHDSIKAHDMDTLLASLSIFDSTHLGRLGTAVSMETSSNYGDSLDTSTSVGLDQGETVIPVLPKGQHLTFSILSTWGDHHYVGLNGIEVFNDDGHPAMVNSITADPADINILPGYHSDPRVVTNLLDGVNITRDDFHMWLTPFTPGKDHVIHITLSDVTTVAMIRIWNYNKSRIHSCRGARHVAITLDNQLVFDGELARASGEVNNEEVSNYGDTILFTTDDEVLMKMALHDQVFQQEHFKCIPNNEQEFSRPSTGGLSAGSHDLIEVTTDTTSQVESSPLVASVLQLQLVTTWGDPYYIGLTGLAVLGAGQEPLPLSSDQLQACPRDLNDLPEYTDDDRTLDKLVDGVNVTSCDSHMWLAPYTAGGDHVISITFNAPEMVTGLCVWNYNKSLEDTKRGAKEVLINVDGNVVSNHGNYWLFRQAPGNNNYNYGQVILFDGDNNLICLDNTINFPPNMSTVAMPTGFVYELQLLTTWGDPYYVGLNGLEVFTEDGSQLMLTSDNIAAFPDSVNALGGVVKDVRTPDKLIDGCHDTTEGAHMWLAPILPNTVNRVYILFNRVVTLGAIKIWNYARTPSRGVRELSVLVDGLLVHNGEVAMADTRPCLPSLTPCISAHVILFDDHMIKPISNSQDVQLTNDSQVIHSHSHLPQHSQLAADQALRPVTSLTATTTNKRGYTKPLR